MNDLFSLDITIVKIQMGECKASARAGDTENCGASGEGGGVGGGAMRAISDYCDSASSPTSLCR